MSEPSSRLSIALTVNGVPQNLEVEARRTLADFLREQLRLTGTHLGCEHGVCGACTVLVDGQPARACLMFAVQADGCDVRTVEGLGTPDGGLSDLQSAFRERHALQCGFCTPGMLAVASALLEDNPTPTADEVRDAISGNICRCTGYLPIVEAILDTARARRAGVAA
jgi:aerobic-type carbon monoxide dehydrogenase small subunit (CoxS/CutS family)